MFVTRTSTLKFPYLCFVGVVNCKDTTLQVGNANVHPEDSVCLYCIGTVNFKDTIGLYREHPH